MKNNISLQVTTFLFNGYKKVKSLALVTLPSQPGSIFAQSQAGISTKVTWNIKTYNGYKHNQYMKTFSLKTKMFTNKFGNETNEFVVCGNLK